MSAAASMHELEPRTRLSETDTDAAESASLSKLRSMSPPFTGGPVIAVDLDDVLSQTNADISLCAYFLRIHIVSGSIELD